MSIVKHIAPLAAVGCAALLVACSAGDKAADDSAAVTTPAATPPAAPAAISLAQLAGKWNTRSVPASGSDTTPTLSVLTATADTTGWTMTLTNRPPQPVRVRVMGDSVMMEVGPYESVRRRGVMVTTQSVTRMQGDSLVGMTVARYKNAGADSVLRLRTSSKRAP